jgi:protein-tyrosine phosphatase
MYDIHTHILYGIDDGAKDLDQMLEMARDAARNDVTDLIATPHHANGHYWNPAHRVRELVDSANAALRSAGIPVRIHPGQEVRLHRDLIADLQDSIVTTLNQSRYLLLELPAMHVPQDAVHMIHELRLLGITPIIAHPERNTGIANNLQELSNLIEAGALAQLTTHSLTGKFGKKTRRLAVELCKRHMIHFIASDAHNEHSRNSGMKEAFDAIAQLLGHAYVEYYMANARAVLEDEPIHVWPVDRPVKKRRFFF